MIGRPQKVLSLCISSQQRQMERAKGWQIPKFGGNWGGGGVGEKEIKKNEIDGYVLLGWQMLRELHTAQGPSHCHEKVSPGFFQRFILPHLTDLWQKLVRALKAKKKEKCLYLSVKSLQSFQQAGKRWRFRFFPLKCFNLKALPTTCIEAEIEKLCVLYGRRNESCTWTDWTGTSEYKLYFLNYIS